MKSRESYLAVMGMVMEERDRQEELHAPNTCASAYLDPFKKLSILMEEVGEVANALNESYDEEELVKELVQVSAVCVAWIESLT